MHSAAKMRKKYCNLGKSYKKFHILILAFEVIVQTTTTHLLIAQYFHL